MGEVEEKDMKDNEKGTGGESGTRQKKIGHLVIIGGGFDDKNENIYKKIIELAGGRGNAKIAIIPTASSDPVTSAYCYIPEFRKYGGESRLIPIATENDEFTLILDESKWADYAFKKNIAQKILDHNCIFLTGGVQMRLSRVLGERDDPSPVLAAIQRVYEQGGVIADTSAGAAIMSETMIGSGESLAALLDGVAFEDTYADPHDNRVFLTEGWGFVKNAIIDQHFIKRGRLGRLIRSLAHTGYSFGVGIDEGTTIVFEDSLKRFKVYGESGVIVVDWPEGETREGLPLEHITLHYLTEGDVFDLETKNINVDTTSKKAITSPDYGGNTLVPDIFAPDRIKWILTEDLVDNSAEEAVGIAFRMKNGTKGEGVQLNFSKTNATKGYRGEIINGNTRYTALNIGLTIKPIEITIKA